jgi:hypothetical protein
MKICRADCQQGEESFSQDKWPIYAANSPKKNNPAQIRESQKGSNYPKANQRFSESDRRFHRWQRFQS